MLKTLQDLIRHKGHVDASLLKAMRRHPPASMDTELLRLLHHILVANRYWLAIGQDRPFDLADETRPPQSLDGLAARYVETHTSELEWISSLSEEDLARTVESPFLPGAVYTLAEGLMQVCLHSHGHRSQIAMRLRALGGVPPPLDFIVWLKERPAAEWE